MPRYDHPVYGRHTRSHHQSAGAQQSRGSASSVDAATYSRAARPQPPRGRAAYQRSFAIRMTVAFVGLFVGLVALGASCEPDPASSLLCAERFCEPVAP